MNIADILVIIAIAIPLLIIGFFAFKNRNKPKGCCGGCSNCNRCNIKK